MHRRHCHKTEIADKLRADMLDADVDMIAVGGDLVNFGLEHEFQQSRAWLERLGDSAKVFAVPGNHEAMVAGWRTTLARHWGAYGAGGQDSGAFMRRAGPVALIGVSTAVATPPFFASGKVGKRQLGEISALLDRAHADRLCPVVVMHHPPTKITSRRKGLSDHRAVCTLLAEKGAALILHGHTHHADLSWINAPHGVIPVLGVPSLSMNTSDLSRSGSWRKIQIERVGQGWSAHIEDHAIDWNGDLKIFNPIRMKLPQRA